MESDGEEQDFKDNALEMIRAAIVLHKLQFVEELLG